ncbi:hypothetical protein COCC4DRAFT_128085 [Bipolaris maydis ATCC 48331]|uniref:Uncharacterized protein n=2 Tax=Cochliobolus heterostrophus TaxID=5016 RepID=M2US51_COCH5|nr:uncharacterized protein COCC4DRAFT_128085 [Bipolaris maydis ATCC 48331]EMD90717.1 hypothetical protein COCHEDRAFT_1157707 [Bipolaris maydis C5]ENI09072.1 hypothetical protein COCC4DRAFT_128085 [Bipolaris maydis ATCC 48331]
MRTWRQRALDEPEWATDDCYSLPLSWTLASLISPSSCSLFRSTFCNNCCASFCSRKAPLASYQQPVGPNDVTAPSTGTPTGDGRLH